MDTKRLYLIRHGVTNSIFNTDLSGSNDLPLNETGIRQIQRLVTYLDKQSPDVIYSSPLMRARQTAEIISSHFTCRIIEIPELREIDIGDWDGLSFPEIKKNILKNMKNGFTLLETVKVLKRCATESRM